MAGAAWGGQARIRRHERRLGRQALFVLLLLSTCSGTVRCAAPSIDPASDQPARYPILNVRQAPARIGVDGDLSDAGSRDAEPATSFSGHSPVEEVTLPVKTPAFDTCTGAACDCAQSGDGTPPSDCLVSRLDRWQLFVEIQYLLQTRRHGGATSRLRALLPNRRLALGFPETHEPF